MSETTTELTPKELIDKVMADLGLTVTAEFIPQSKSRNAKSEDRSLNWTVTLWIANHRPVGGIDKHLIIETDYSAGSGHCPASKLSVKAAGHANSMLRDGLIRWECEHGYPCGTGFMGRVPGSKPLMPETADVLSSLVMESDALDCSTFEEWADTLGYDSDSRKAEGIYRASLEIALKLRNGIGDAGLAALREACQDY